MQNKQLKLFSKSNISLYLNKLWEDFTRNNKNYKDNLSESIIIFNNILNKKLELFSGNKSFKHVDEILAPNGFHGRPTDKIQRFCVIFNINERDINLLSYRPEQRFSTDLRPIDTEIDCESNTINIFFRVRDDDLPKDKTKTMQFLLTQSDETISYINQQIDHIKEDVNKFLLETDNKINIEIQKEKNKTQNKEFFTEIIEAINEISNVDDARKNHKIIKTEKDIDDLK